ncbi:hypothetical protein GAO09_23975 [Rhizobiales bacterium RZME27]|uniref:Response regulatory domain-containing protein n=1 Tax=Endobacterium cereale TaxID=2663029 RepID=A0A6A8AGV3_9HYPH|nr:hypothetical protein [Endobacterium cereale]MEB2847249.1 hypothetical protein [Endobacterium cereale]MQY49098.1 hypothetical protein [Endobacterium cereale]
METPPEPTAGIVLVLDEMPLRREAYLHLLGPWAMEQKLTIQAGDLHRQTVDDGRTKIIIVSVGGRSIRELQFDNKLWEMAGDAPPTVIISDLRDPVEIASALTWGVRGFVPTELGPKLALSTLTFILSGGDFFPSSALQRSERL